MLIHMLLALLLLVPAIHLLLIAHGILSPAASVRRVRYLPRILPAMTRRPLASNTTSTSTTIHCITKRMLLLIIHLLLLLFILKKLLLVTMQLLGLVV